jgi:CarD family transcriptional regulator
MYQVNDTVIYSTQGVCRIENITEKDFMGKKREYYVLIPMSNPGTTLFAPTDNEAVLAKMRRVLSAEEIHRLVEAAAGEELAWIVNENERKEKFRQILSSGDHKSLILMIKAIWIQKNNRLAEGRRLHMSDERFFKDAEQLLYDEFQYVLNINKADLISYIFKPEP